MSRFGGKLHVDSSEQGVIESHAMVMLGEEVTTLFLSNQFLVNLYAKIAYMSIFCFVAKFETDLSALQGHKKCLRHIYISHN